MAKRNKIYFYLYKDVVDIPCIHVRIQIRIRICICKIVTRSLNVPIWALR